MTAGSPPVVLAMYPGLPARLFPPAVADRLRAAAGTDLAAPLTEFGSEEARARLAGARVLVTGWGCPLIDEPALRHAPRLRAVVHAAGSVKGHVSPAVFARGIPVSSAASANALPVAEYTLAMILLAGKSVLAFAREYRTRREDLGLIRDGDGGPGGHGNHSDHSDHSGPGVRGVRGGFGNYGTTVGLVGASRIGRRVAELLAPFDLEVLVADPYLDVPAARSLGARLVGPDELFARSDIVSLHAPATDDTRGMVTAARLAAMRDGATLINTARGSLVDQEALVAELATGRLSAVLDVTEPEVPPAGSALWDLPNVILTPHVAGALGNELARLGACAVDEVLLALAGRPLRHPVDPDLLAITA